MDRHSRILIEYSVLDAYKILLICLSLLACPFRGRFGPALPKVATAICVSACRILATSFSGKRISGAAVSNLNLKTVHPAVPCCVPFGLGGSPMWRILVPRPLLHGGTAILQLFSDGLCEISDDFLPVAGSLQPACQLCHFFGWRHLPSCQTMLPSSLPVQFPVQVPD